MENWFAFAGKLAPQVGFERTRDRPGGPSNRGLARKTGWAGPVKPVQFGPPWAHNTDKNTDKPIGPDRRNC